MFLGWRLERIFFWWGGNYFMPILFHIKISVANSSSSNNKRSIIADKNFKLQYRKVLWAMAIATQ